MILDQPCGCATPWRDRGHYTIVSSGIYGTTLIGLYTSFTLYHNISTPRPRKLLQKLDHAAIFLLIAGTYIPFTLVNLRGEWGWILFTMVWSIAIAGVAMELIVENRYKRISIGLYPGLGWLVSTRFHPAERFDARVVSTS